MKQLTTNILTIGFLFLCCNIQAQNSNNYIFEQELNGLIAKTLGRSLTVFEISNKQYVDTIQTTKASSIKKVSDEYKQVSAMVSKAEKEYEDAKAKNALINKQNVELNTLLKNVNTFLQSKDVFDSKKQLLIDAQKISDKYKLGHLLYADANINTKYKSKFFVLSRNKLNLKIYLKKLIVKLKASIKPVKSIDNSEQERRLKSVKERLKRTKKYYYIKSAGEATVNRYAEMSLGKRVYKPENVIVGRYIGMGEYYLIEGNDTDIDMVSVSDAKMKKIKKEDFIFQKKFTVLKDQYSNKSYLVINDFLSQYSVYSKDFASHRF